MLAAIIVLMQIASTSAEVIYYGHEPMEVESEFSKMYAEIEECADLEGNYNRLVFMQADSLFRTVRIMDLFDRRKLWGHISIDIDIPKDTITIQKNAPTFYKILRHEMGHHVFNMGGKPYGHHRSNDWARCSDPAWNTGS